MAKFCGKCGATIEDNAGFCGRCGARQGTNASSAARNTVVPIAAPQSATTNHGGRAVKIVGALLIVVLGFGLVATAGIWYAAHRVKQAVIAKAHEYGVEAPTGRPERVSEAARGAGADACILLTKEEATQLLGEPVERIERQAQACAYYGPAGLAARLSEEQMSGVVSRSQTTKGVDAGLVADAATNLAASFGRRTGAAETSSEELPLLTVVVAAEDGRAQMAALAATRVVFSGIKGTSSEIPNLGDRAIRMGNLGLSVLKGETMIRVIPGPVPEARGRSVSIARAILPRV